MRGNRRVELSPERNEEGCDYVYFDPYHQCVTSEEEAMHDAHIPRLYSCMLPREYALVPDDVAVWIRNETPLIGP